MHILVHGLKTGVLAVSWLRDGAQEVELHM